MTIKEYEQSIKQQYGTLVLDKKQTAKELGISPNGLDNLRKDGEIAFFTIASRVKFHAYEIAKVMGLK